MHGKGYACLGMAYKHRERCSTPLVMQEMQIKTTMTYHYKFIGIVKIRITPNAREDMEALDHSCIANRNVKPYTLKDSLTVSYKTNCEITVCFKT
jgi:hypothetical protein